MKPLNRKSYGTIPHLPGSRLGQTDRYITEGQAKIATIKTRDARDVVIIQEKVDGCCCAVCKVDGIIYPLTRSGGLACQSGFEHHQLFYRWAMERIERFNALLQDGERLVGEWLAKVHGTKYTVNEETVFRAFDLMIEDQRFNYQQFMERVAGRFQTTPLVSHGPPRTVNWCRDYFPVSGAGAETIEGYVYRVERNGEVDFLAKWVRSDYIPGQFMEQDIWNWRF